MSHLLSGKQVDDNFSFIFLFLRMIFCMVRMPNNSLANDEWLKCDSIFTEILFSMFRNILMPVQLEHQQQILPFQERNIDILKSKHFGTKPVTLFLNGLRSTSSIHLKKLGRRGNQTKLMRSCLMNRLMSVFIKYTN